MTKIKSRTRVFHCLVVLLFVNLQSAKAQTPDKDLVIQGEYSGTLDRAEGAKWALQLIARGKGKFSCVGYTGGLPGDGWNLEPPVRVEDVEIAEGVLTFKGEHATAIVSNGEALIEDLDGNDLGKLKRIERESPTLGKQPPSGATVLFDGSSADEWELKGKPGQMTDDGLLKHGTASKKLFQDHHLHVEFRLPFNPEARGQARGNSGVYLQGRYEVQLLDSFGLSGEQNECGGIYSIRKPDQNMCFPPMRWQTYDIEFHAAEYDGETKTKNAWMTVKHNGVTIHENVELPKSTTAAPNKEGPAPGFVFLQDHNNPVHFRNIWVTVPDGSDASDTTEIQDRQTAQSLRVDHPIELDYLLYLPNDYASEEKWPLMLFLHGAGERGDDLEKVKIHGPPKLIKNGKEFPCIVVSPQCPSGRWWEPVSLTALLDEIEEKYKVDSSRIYVTGLSMGGFGTWNLASYSPERFAAIAPICSGGDKTMTPYTIRDQVPIWVFHGAKDNVVPLSRTEELVAGFKKMGVEIKQTIYPDAGHDSWTKTYDNEELYEWLFSHQKK